MQRGSVCVNTRTANEVLASLAQAEDFDVGDVEIVLMFVTLKRRTACRVWVVYIEVRFIISRFQSCFDHDIRSRNGNGQL